MKRYGGMRDDPSGRPAGQTELGTEIAFFVALLATALALGAALAHVFELPNKIGLPGDEYFIVQQVYRGWNRLGFVLLVQLIGIVTAAVLSRRRPRVALAAALAAVFLICAQAVFWIFTYPANVATENWTAMPENWEALRRQWEYSHAVGALFQLLAMCALVVALLARGRRPG